MKYGAILEACREKAGLTQEKMAELLHRTQSCISRLESNKKTLDLQTAVKWGEVTNAREAIVALLYGMDGVSIITNILPFIGG
ncbi:XRE family transcriptional regulator [Paenibacillaceae bacterium]|nr:XRE family transcriptional regulator [Paenibacillaceae bacterium]